MLSRIPCGKAIGSMIMMYAIIYTHPCIYFTYISVVISK